MAKRLNTVEYAFPQIIAQTAAGTVQNFTQITVDIPETTNRTFVSAFADIATLDAVTTAASPTSWSFGLRVGGTGAFLNQTVTDTITNSGENMSFHFIFDVSSQFKTNFTGTSHVIDASFALAVSASNNSTCKLVLTYEWDDTDQTRIKTVRIPIESSTNALSATLANISGGGDKILNVPALDTFLPEGSKGYKDIFFETWVNESTTAAQTINPSLGYALDDFSQDWDYGHEDALVSARLYRRIWQKKDMDTATKHQFKACTSGTAASMPFRLLGSVLNVTYTYYEPSTYNVLNSIILPGSDEFGYPGNTTSADKSRFKRTLSIQEENPQLRQSGLLFSFIDSGAVTLNVAVGNQAFTPYTNAIATTQVAGGYMFVHNFDVSSRKGAGLTLSKNGEYNVDWYSTSAAAGSTGTNVSALMYLNYESSVSTLPGGSANHNHTVIPFFKAHGADALINTVTIQPIDIPETNYWISGIVPVISTYKASATNSPDFMYYSAELDASTNQGAGWKDLYAGCLISDAEMAVQLMFSGARKEFKRWPNDTDNDRMYLEKIRSFRFARGTASYFGSYWPITYNTLVNNISGQVTGYTGNGSGISIKAYDEVFLKEVIYEGSTNIGGYWGFPWYNSSTNIRVNAYQDASHSGMIVGRTDVSLNIAFGSTTPGGNTATSWVF